MLMPGFEPGPSGVGSDHSDNFYLNCSIFDCILVLSRARDANPQPLMFNVSGWIQQERELSYLNLWHKGRMVAPI